MKKFIKIFGIVFAAFVLLIVAAALIVPQVVDVDKFRPQIVQAANDKLNGKLELGKLSLSLWGQIRVQVQGMAVADTTGRKVVSVKDAYFHVPFLSIFTGSPQLVLKMQRPEVLVIKNKAGKLNLMGLMKESPKDAAQAPPAGGQPSAPAKPGDGKVEVPGIVARARLGVEFLNAQVTYNDEATGLDTQIKDLNLVMRNLSLSHKMDIEMWADLDTKLGKTFAVLGPARLKAQAKPSVVNGVFDRADIEANVDLDGLQMTAPDLFEKKKGVAANAVLVMMVSPKEAKIDRFDVKFFNAEVKASGAVSNLGATSPVVDFKVGSNEIELKAWSELVPMLKTYELGGTARLNASAKGPSDKLGYAAKFVINGLTAKAPNLKAQPRLDVLVDVVTDQIQNLVITMKAPANEMQFKGKLVSFTKPQGTFELTSSGMDLDQLINWPSPVEKTAQTAKPAAGGAGGSGTGASGGSGTGAAKGKPAEDLDASVDSLRTNPVAAGSTIVINSNVKMMKAKGIKMNDLVGKLYLRDLVAGLDGFSMKLWSGSVKANFASQLKPKTPTYTFSTVVDSLDLRQAVEANVAMFKNTVVGKANFQMNGSGSSFNTEPAKANLKAKGNMKVQDATFGTIDVAKMASDAINKSLESIAAKVPALKGKTLGVPGGKASKYELISSDFTIGGGKFDAPNFLAKAAPNQGIDLKGNTQVGIIDMSLKTRWEVIDTYNLLKAKDLSVNISGTEVPHILAEGDGPVKFVVNAGCTVMQPCYSYTEVPEFLGKVAANNVAAAAGGRAKSEIMKAIPKSAPPAVKNALEGLGKRLFR